jgi:hypothetical protein
MKPSMKKIYFLPVLVMLSCHSKGPSALSSRLQYLLEHKKYFQLDKALQTAAPDLPAAYNSYFSAYVDNAFNRNESCIARVDSLMGTTAGGGTAGTGAAAHWPDSLKASLLELQADSYFKLGQYAKAAANDSLVIGRYPRGLDSAGLENVMNTLLVRNALKSTPAQQTTITANTTIHWTRDKIGLIEIPVKTGGQTTDAIFDTRANISSISKTYAEQLHLRPIDVSYQEGAGITNAQFKVGLGVADSLYIGNILVQHAVFQVMPDTILYIAPIKYQLNVILGLPVIAQLQEIQWYSNGDLTIPLTPAQNDLRNFALDGLDPVLALISDNDTLGFHFDSGASSSVLYAAYFSKYKSTILRQAFKRTQTFGGAGGTRQKESYVLPSIRLTLDKHPVTIDSVTVFQNRITAGEKFYGNIGQDFMRQFTKMTIDFRYMYVTGE